MIGHAGNFTGALNSIVVGEVKNRILIEFGNHGYTAISSGRGYVLSESISISATGGLWDRGEQLGAVERSGYIGMIACIYLGFNFFG